MCTLGCLERRGTYVLSEVAVNHDHMFLWVLHVASCGLHLAGCLGVRPSYGEHRLNGVALFESSIMCMWLRSAPENSRYLRVFGTHDIIVTSRAKVTRICASRSSCWPLCNTQKTRGASIVLCHTLADFTGRMWKAQTRLFTGLYHSCRQCCLPHMRPQYTHYPRARLTQSR